MGPLAKRFIEFCRTVAGAEEVDTITTPTGQQLKRADFLFKSRSIICEIKSLEKDTAPKFITFLKEAGFDLTPGEYNLRELFAMKPNGAELFAKATNLVATAVADGLSDANKQIGDTKILFGLPTADGLVVILNGMVDVLGPQLVIKRVLERLEKLADDGTPYHANVALVMYFSEKHLRETGLGDAAVAFPIPNEKVVPVHDLKVFATELVKGWAAFNGRWYDEQAWDLDND